MYVRNIEPAREATIEMLFKGGYSITDLYD
jgi:hypothetical protein